MFWKVVRLDTALNLLVEAGCLQLFIYWQGWAGYSSSSTGRGSLDKSLHVLSGSGWIQLFMFW
jgi:hypothetical protein